VQKVVDLRRAGKGYAAISRTTGLTKGKVRGMLKRHEYCLPDDLAPLPRGRPAKADLTAGE